MTQLILNMLYIAIFIACFELSGFIHTTEDLINKKRHILGKPGNFSWGYPLGCNVCQCFWCEIAYVLICGQVTLFTIMCCILFAISQRVFISLIQLVLDTLETLFIKLNEFINQ